MKVVSYIKQNWHFVLLGLLGFFARFYNYENFLYFIYDQGRDAFKLQEIVGGNLTLIGPTTGIEGFFLGPLWYYLGVPGYIFSNGSPYGIALWYILLASLAIPCFYIIAKQLFPKQTGWALVTFALLVFIPGSIWGSVFIWNPLLSIPLMAAAFIALGKARSSRIWLVISFLFLSFVLHAELAYGIFILPVLYLLTFWIRQRFSIIDYTLAGLAAAVGFIPQIVFELRHNFIMTNALLSNIGDQSTKANWGAILTQRPIQLLHATNELLVGASNSASSIGVVFVLIVLGSLWFIWQKSASLNNTQNKRYHWQLLAIIAVTPYIAFMFWRGNYGNFFPYYLAPHFIFLIPLLVLGVKEISQLINKFYKFSNKKLIYTIQVGIITVLLTFSWNEYYYKIAVPDNQAGMKTIHKAVTTSLNWLNKDATNMAATIDTQPSQTLITFTPNYLTHQYDYMLHYVAKKLGQDIPNTQVYPTDDLVYTIIEPDRQIPEKRFVPWHETVSNGRVLVRKEKVGVLTLETWAKSELVAQYQGFNHYQASVTERMCW